MKSKIKPERRPKILAIDDKMDNLVTLSALLKNLMPDCTVITAQSGPEGIVKAKAERPDAILLDIKMPEMDGFETCRRLMDDESTKHIPVIMITAIKTDPDSRIKGLECGANAFLSKPIDEYELVSQIKVALRIKKAEDDLREERNSIKKTLQERTASLRQELTERRLVAKELRESNEYLYNLFNYANAPIIVWDPEFRITRFNHAFEKLTGRTSQEVIGKSLEILFPSEQVKSSMSFIRKTQMGERWETLEIDILNADGTDRTLLWNSATLMAPDGKTPIATIAQGQDITERKHAEKQLHNTLENLRKAVGTTIQVMASAVETRDPYTAGHQIRSADLARAIAVEMGLSQDKITAIRMAGSIHDIGKLSIPAEILSKPTKLSEIEFRLIKEHSRRGYEILKDVESPWPLAEIVYQHHERLDGSGYPRNLKGEEICIEARILAVADVVESMASHRPYRPGLGIDAALNEIEKNSGTIYDNAVADACLGLFRTKGFKLEGT